MALERLVLLLVAVVCVIDLVKSRRVANRSPGSIGIVLVADGPSHEVEGLVRYLYWEFSVRNRLYAEIAVATGGRGGGCESVAERLKADGFLVDRVSGEPSLVFFIGADRAAAG
jgi:hypothetical protein